MVSPALSPPESLQFYAFFLSLLREHVDVKDNQPKIKQKELTITNRNYKSVRNAPKHTSPPKEAFKMKTIIHKEPARLKK